MRSTALLVIGLALLGIIPARAAPPPIVLPGVPSVAVPPSELPAVWVPCVPRQTPIELGVSEVGRVDVDARTQDITLHSTAMQADSHIDVLLPTGFDPSVRYPVLYLLHGALGNYTNWTANGVAAIVGDLPLIVVMPDDSPNGSYSDWFGTEVIDVGGRADAWESYHVGELVPWVDAHYPTIASPAGRFIAGLSSGGGGTMKYAAAHPGVFGAAGEFSGAVDTDMPNYHFIADLLFFTTYIPGTRSHPAHCTWGDPNTNEVVWRDNDPTYLAPNLRGTRLYLATGNGQPGEYDDPNSGPDVVESTVHDMNVLFDAALTAAGVDHTIDFYGNGHHSWPYWKRDLQRFLAWLQPAALAPVVAPDEFSVRSARPTFTAWDWTFTPHRAVTELTYVSGVSERGVTATGSGTLDVVTAALYEPGGSYLVGTAAAAPTTVVADGAGRLRFTLDLGPSHTVQQMAFGPDATARWTTVTATIDASP